MKQSTKTFGFIVIKKKTLNYNGNFIKSECFKISLISICEPVCMPCGIPHEIVGADSAPTFKTQFRA